MSDPRQQADALVEEGLKLYKAGRLDDALARWEAALDLVDDHKQALEYYGYVERNRDALEESFNQAAASADDSLDVTAGATDDADVEWERDRASFAGGQLTPAADGHTLDPPSVAGDPAQLEPLGEDDETPIMTPIREEKTSRIGRELLEIHLGESREGLELSSSFESQEQTPQVAGLPNILLEEAAEDSGEQSGVSVSGDNSFGDTGGEMTAGDNDLSDSSEEELILLSDGDDEDLEEEGAEFTWEEEPSKGPVDDDSDPGLQIDLSPGTGGSSDNLELEDDPSFKEGAGYQEVLLAGEGEEEEEEEEVQAAGSSPDIPELPNIPVSAPFDDMDEGSGDSNWVEEELERVGTGDVMDELDSPSSGDHASYDLPMDSLEVLSGQEAEGPIDEIQGLLEEGKLEDALGACNQILVDLPGDKAAQEMLDRIKGQLQEVYTQRIGDLEEVPTVLVPRHEIVWQNLDHRTGFLLSRIDGFLSYQDIIDVSGMPMFEACRILVGLMDEEIIGAG